MITPREAILVYIGIYYGMRLNSKESTKRLYELAKAMKMPMDELLSLMDEFTAACEGLQMHSKISGIKFA